MVVFKRGLMKIGDLLHRLAVAIILTGHLGRCKKEKGHRVRVSWQKYVLNKQVAKGACYK
jgi:hypothetical protein